MACLREWVLSTPPPDFAQLHETDLYVSIYHHVKYISEHTIP